VTRRAFDVGMCLLALPFALAVGSLLALAVFLDSPGPVFYRSPRIGRNGQPFSMLKFRTMLHGAAGPPLSCEGDERYTPLGRWLSRHRLDELPQIWNVLRGDMRLVGPRPEVEEFVTAYPEEYERILSVLPGLTGPAQLRYAGEGVLLAEAVDRLATYRESILPAKIEIDLAYAEHSSVRGDLEVLWRTVLLPLGRLRRYALVTGGRQAAAAPATRIVVLLALAALALTGTFAAEAVSS
jgi:lipopolysaccharide/colanic/teichoic acid biosynthesis glycosyltransferase